MAMANSPVIENIFRDQQSILKPRPPLGAFSIFEHSILPSFGLHGGLGLIAYGLAYWTNRVEIKDYLWPSGMILNAWWTAIGRHTLLEPHLPISESLQNLSSSQKLLLGAVTLWGGRLLYRITKRSIQRGKDHPRYEQAKQANYFWHKATLLFGLEAVFQTLTCLPFTLPFQTDLLPGFIGASAEFAPQIRWTAAGLFTAALALEILADGRHLDTHDSQKVKSQAQVQVQGFSKEKDDQLLRTRVWSVVRHHPNYLGDALCHVSFALWCYGSQLFSFSQLLGPVASYLVLRWSGDGFESGSYQ